MAGGVLDARGVLVEYVRVPATEETPAATTPEWAAVLRRAGLDPDAARPVPPAGIPPVFGDERHAWDLGEPAAPTHVEAASFRGRPVWFRVQDPAAPLDESPPRAGPGRYVILGILLFGTVLARRSVRVGSADRDGARRIAAFTALGWVVALGLYDPRHFEPSLVFLSAMIVVLLAAVCWVSYLALEPVVRRRWPDTLVSWTRLLRGRVLDPLVGRDVLLGVLGGIAATLVGQAGLFAQGAGASRWPAWPEGLTSGWAAASDPITHCAYAVVENLFILLVLVLLRQLLRQTWAALALTLVMFVGLQHLGSPPDLVSHLLIRGVLWGILVWRGLVSGVAAMSVRGFLGVSLMTTHLGAWYANEAITGILATLALAAWGFYASLGGRPLFGDPNREAV
jgi:serine/threonine-protein kinase